MLQLLLFAVLSVTVYTTDIKQRLEIPPPPVNGFNLNAYLGQWFLQFRKAPCSWPGSLQFTDFERNITPDGKGGFFSHLTWRSRGMCNRITARQLVISPGVYIYEDNIGDSISGKLIIAATDYKTFVIYWGCTKMSAKGKRCEDPWLTVATRFRFPQPMVINMIENILRTRWDITIGELQKVSHKMPCQSNFPKKC